APRPPHRTVRRPPAAACQRKTGKSAPPCLSRLAGLGPQAALGASAAPPASPRTAPSALAVVQRPDLCTAAATAWSAALACPDQDRAPPASPADAWAVSCGVRRPS